MIRYYLLPIERIGSARGPLYFQWRFNPSGISCPWSMMDYGLMDQCVVCADIQDADHTALAAHADVLSIPVNLDNSLSGGAVTVARDYLESVNIPGTWVSASDTYRSVLRSVCGIFLFLQRVTAIAKQPINWATISLNIQWQNLPAAWQAAMLQAAGEMGFSTAGLQANTALRNLLKNMADQWTKPIEFGISSL